MILVKDVYLNFPILFIILLRYNKSCITVTHDSSSFFPGYFFTPTQVFLCNYFLLLLLINCTLTCMQFSAAIPNYVNDQSQYFDFADQIWIYVKKCSQLSLHTPHSYLSFFFLQNPAITVETFPPETPMDHSPCWLAGLSVRHVLTSLRS